MGVPWPMSTGMMENLTMLEKRTVSSSFLMKELECGMMFRVTSDPEQFVRRKETIM